MRRSLRRPLIARLRGLAGRARSHQTTDGIAEYPVRLTPERIRVWEEYRYSFTTGANPEYRQTPDKISGDIQIDLPFDRLTGAARADAAAVLGVAPEAVSARYGALGFSRPERTDIATRFFESESFTHYALPLSVPLVRENEPHLVVRSERGDHERHHLYYTPKDPVPFPFTLDVEASDDGATFTSTSKPGMVSSQQRVLHVSLECTMMRPQGVREQDVKMTLDVFLLFWCAPVAAHQFALDAPADATLNVDARMNQVSVGGAVIPFISTGRGPLRGRIEFRILVKDPTAFNGVDELKGLFKVSGHGFTMSAMQMAFFNAAGYLQPTDESGAPLIEYRSELYGNFTLPLATAAHAAPLAFERHLSWFSPESAPDAYPLIRELFLEENFALQGELQHDAHGYQWSMIRTVDGKPLNIEITLKRRDSMQLVELDDTETQGRRKTAALQQMYYHDLALSARYRGDWERAQAVLGRLEQRLRDKLHLRGKRTERTP